MVDIQSATAEIRRGIKKKKEERIHRTKIQCPHLLRRAAIIKKFDRGLGQILHDDLYWFDVLDRVFFKLAVTVHRCRTTVPDGLLHPGLQR